MSEISTIEKVMVRLLQTNIFYASLLAQMRRIEVSGELAKHVPTAGVTIRNGRIELYWNPKFFEQLTVDEAKGVMEHECLAPGTFITGVNKKIEDIKIGDKVLDANGKFVKVKNIIKRKYKGLLYTIKPALSNEFSVTANHPLLTIPFQRTHLGKKYGKPMFVTAENLVASNSKQKNKGTFLLMPKLTTLEYPATLDLTPYLLFDNKSYRTLTLQLDEELAWVLGYYTAEGHFGKGKQGSGSLVWSGHRIKDLPHFERVLNWLHKYGYSGSVHRRGSFACILQNRSSILGRAFEEWCGKGASNKHIPDFILLNKNTYLLKSFIDGFAAGDGCVQNNYNALSTISPTLAYQLQLALISLGETGVLSFKKNNPGGFSKPVNNKGLYTVNRRKRFLVPRDFGSFKETKAFGNLTYKLNNNFTGFPIRKITTSNYDGYVYNLETESHTYTIDNFVSSNCLHIVLDHIIRKGGREHQLWNIAADLSCNQLIEKLPKDCVALDKFPKEWGIVANDTSEHYYELMQKHQNKMEISDDGEGGYNVTVKDSKGNVVGRFKMKTPGSHDEWADGDVPELAKEVVRQAIKEAVSQTQRRQGTMPAGLDEIINEWLKPPVISWRRLLRQFVAASIKSGHKNSWKRPNRRFGGEQKGKLADRMIQITVAIDTSGSIGTEDFQAFMSEIRAIQSCYKGNITIIECDAEVQKEYKLTKYSKLDTKFKGRGGTSFKPVFEYIADKKIKTDVLLFFTDLCGDFPSKTPRYPTVWVSTTEKEKAPFGFVISLVNHPDKKEN